MNDDWRLRATLGDHRQAAALAEQLQSGGHEHELETGAADRVIVSVDDRDVFLYAGTREQAERAAGLVERLSRQGGWSLRTELRRWHPTAEEWEDPDAPLPETPEEVAAEHAELVGRERAESRATGAAEYEVRVECRSHRDTVALAERLAEEGIPSLRRWRYLLVGALDEDTARDLADRLTAEAPAGSTVRVEATMAVVSAETPANPFAVFGGLGG